MSNDLMVVALRTLREKFDARLINEVQQYHGIPSLPVEEMELREAIARVLELAAAGVAVPG